jgi:hypothetical protein
MVREYITGQWGVPLNNTLVYPGDLFTNTFTYAIPNNINDIIFDINNIKVVAFVTENQLGEIITGEGCNVTMPVLVDINEYNITKSNTYNKIYDMLGREWKVQFGDLPKGMYIINNKIQYKL